MPTICLYFCLVRSDGEGKLVRGVQGPRSGSLRGVGGLPATSEQLQRQQLEGVQDSRAGGSQVEEAHMEEEPDEDHHGLLLALRRRRSHLFGHSLGVMRL